MRRTSILNAPLLRRLALMNLVIIAALCLDGFLKPVTVVETYDHFYIYHRYLSRSPTEYFLVSRAGTTIEVDDWREELRPGEHFYIQKGRLSGLNLRVTYGTVTERVNSFRGTLLTAVLCALAFVISLLNLGRWVLIPNVGLNDRLILGASMVMLAVVVFYLL